jgi:hypothetical protein
MKKPVLLVIMGLFFLQGCCAMQGANRDRATAGCKVAFFDDSQGFPEKEERSVWEIEHLSAD